MVASLPLCPKRGKSDENVDSWASKQPASVGSLGAGTAVALPGLQIVAILKKRRKWQLAREKADSPKKKLDKEKAGCNSFAHRSSFVVGVPCQK
jgi:hypothetical protein